MASSESSSGDIWGNDQIYSQEEQYIYQRGDRLWIQHQTASKDSNFAVVNAWTDHHRDYGWIQPIGSNLAVQYGARNLVVTNKIFFARDPQVTEGDRIIDLNGNAYVVRGVTDQAGMNRLWRVDVEIDQLRIFDLVSSSSSSSNSSSESISSISSSSSVSSSSSSSLNSSSSSSDSSVSAVSSSSSSLGLSSSSSSSVSSSSSSSSSSSYESGFIMSVKTDNTGPSNNDQFTIPLDGVSTYNFDWETSDGTSGTHTANTDLTLTFPSGAGTYTVRITENVTSGFATIKFNNGGDKLKLLDITSWGDICWLTLNSSFRGCTNLTATATNVPDLSCTTNLNSTFRDCINLSHDFSSWNVSGIIVFTSLFRGVTGKSFTDVEGWNTGSASSFVTMFFAATNANPDLGSWDITSMTDATLMFGGGTALNTTNYDSLLVGWEAQTEKTNVDFSAGTATYSAGAPATARAALVSNGWTITDGGPA